MITDFSLEPGDHVNHTCDPSTHGIVVAAMIRGGQISYAVAWGAVDEVWHMPYELEKMKLQPRKQPIGFVP